MAVGAACGSLQLLYVVDIHSVGAETEVTLLLPRLCQKDSRDVPRLPI
jgi:hypothetical protein